MPSMTKRKKPQPDAQADPEISAKKKLYKNVGVRVELHDRLEKIAERKDRSVNWVVKQAIVRYLRALEEKEKKKPQG